MSLSDMISESAIAAVLTNPRLPDNPIVECNEAFLTLTGYGRDEIVGRNCRFLARNREECPATDTIRQAIRESKPALVEILNFRKDGTAFRNALMIAPIFGMNGSVDYFLGSQMAVEDARDSEAAKRIAGLTDRQLSVLTAMAEGRLNKQIAYDLGLTERTVKMHRAAMLKALGVRTAAEAIRLAIEAGL